MKFNFEKMFNAGKKAATLTTAAVVTGLAAHGEDINKTADKVFSDSTENKTVAYDAKKMESKVEKTSGKIEIKIANYFETDKAEISQENAQEISKLISLYAQNLNPGNVDQFLSSTPRLNVSCDPRNTNSYENGNRGLAQDRVEQAQKVIQKFISGFDLSKSGLSAVQIKQVIEKFSTMEFNIPETGVVDYHNVVNPKTNNPFTTLEWEELHKPGNESQMLTVYKDMRYVNVELVALNNDQKPGKVKIETSGGVFDVAGMERVFLLVDKSPSMEAHKKQLLDLLRNTQSSNIQTSVIGYTNKIDTSFTAENLKDAADRIEDMAFVNEDKEFTIKETVEGLDLADDNGMKGVMYVITDEELQDVSQEKLTTLARLSEQKNVEIFFTVMIGSEIHKVSLDQIQAAFTEQYNDASHQQKIQTATKQLAIFNKVLKDQLAQASTTPSKQLDKDIAETKEGIAKFQNDLQNFQGVNISDFKTIAKKDIRHIGPDYSNKSNTAVVDFAKNK